MIKHFLRAVGWKMGGGGVERFVYKQNSLGCVIIASTGGVIFELVVVFCAVSMSLKKISSV